MATYRAATSSLALAGVPDLEQVVTDMHVRRLSWGVGPMLHRQESIEITLCATNATPEIHERIMQLVRERGRAELQIDQLIYPVEAVSESVSFSGVSFGSEDVAHEWVFRTVGVPRHAAEANRASWIEWESVLR